MATSLTWAATTYRPEHPKTCYELVEHCTTRFDTSVDGADREHLHKPNGDVITPPDQVRARKTVVYALRLLRSKGDHMAKMREHIAGMALTLPRLARLAMFVRNYGLDHRYGATPRRHEQWLAATRLVHRTALSMLLEVPARNWTEARELAVMAASVLDPLPLAQQRKVANRLARYFRAMLAGEAINDGGPRQWVSTINTDCMEPGYKQGGKAVLEHHRGELVPGADYVFKLRRSAIDKIARFSHVTPKGQWSVEQLNNPYDQGRTLKLCLEPSRWRPVYRIVRHYADPPKH